ncbi:hypothetical protein [Devosia submarina]|uniref:hypothetical protein n=1 Tax=Devosia submarina TaxID=1173082 RepID=UPI000D388DF7|nr:hypothetical protein [Devosia submarina]
MVLPRRGALLIGGFAVLLALFLALPARTITTAYVNDVLIFLDGANRIAFGQVPNRDFHTALGPLVYYIPAIGFGLSGRMGGALPVGMGVLILLLGPVFVHVLLSRLRPMLALPFGAFLLLILAIPANLGDPLSSISFAMYYNRIGWVVLALLAVMYLHPLDKAPWWRDAACAAILVLVALYTKITYAPPAFALLLLIACDRLQRLWAGAALALVGCGMLLVELVWRGSFAHVQDLIDTARVSGERNLALFIRVVLNNFSDFAIALLLAGMALYRTRRLLDGCFYLLCIGAGVLIISQNAHSWGIITLFAAGVVAAETCLRDPGVPSRLPRSASGAPLLFWVLVLPGLGKHAIGMGFYAVLAISGFGTPLGLPQFGDVRFGRLWSPGDNGFTELYVGNFPEGAALLGEIENPGRVLVLDFSNPLSAGMGLVPPRGDISWMHWGRNLDAEHHPAPEELFADVALVMIPRIGINSAQLEQLYGPFIAQHYRKFAETDGWTAYRLGDNE